MLSGEHAGVAVDTCLCNRADTPVCTFFPRGDLDEIEARVEEEIREAAQWALMQPDPAPEDALGFVYKEL